MAHEFREFLDLLGLAAATGIVAVLLFIVITWLLGGDNDNV